MSARPLEILYEDNHLLAVAKPCGVATMGAPAGEPSLVTLVKEYLRTRYGKTGNVYLGVVSRLDGPVTGVVVFARTSKAAARLSEQFRHRDVEKVYWALVQGVPRPSQGKLIDWLVEHPRHRKSLVARPDTPGARQAVLTYRLLAALPAGSLLEVCPQTGRKHQIRAQLAHFGCPILGDFKYGHKQPFPGRGIGLHARQVVFTHPTRDERIRIVAAVPASWAALGVREPGRGEAGQKSPD